MHRGTGARKTGVDRTSASGQVVGYRKLSSRGIIEATVMADRKRKKKKGRGLKLHLLQMKKKAEPVSVNVSSRSSSE